MSRRKGELNGSAIDSGWPHQVAIHSDLLRGHDYRTVHYFCEGLSLRPRQHSFKRDGEWYWVFCFAEREHAERFHQRLGGEWMDPNKLPRWRGDRKR